MCTCVCVCVCVGVCGGVGGGRWVGVSHLYQMRHKSQSKKKDPIGSDRTEDGLLNVERIIILE